MGNKLNAAEYQHQKIGVNQKNKSTFKTNNHPDAKWFKDAGLGLFVHFGISTVSSEIDLSWGMIKDKPWDNYELTPNEYFKLADSFNPEKFNPDEWLKLASEAGFKYAVFTTKHHDGFALWGTEYGNYNIMNYPWGFDLVEKFVDACRKYDLKVGLYYSPPDWYYNRDYMSFAYESMRMDCVFDETVTDIIDADHKKAVAMKKPDGWDDEYKAYVRGQITELMTKYGKIDLLWFDGGSNLWDSISIEEIRELQPGILVNTRMHSHGDFETFECRHPETAPEGLWEHEDIWAEGPWWGYMKQSGGYKSKEWFLSEYEKVRKFGGNYLINVAPMADGTMPDIVYTRLKELIDDKDC